MVSSGIMRHKRGGEGREGEGKGGEGKDRAGVCNCRMTEHFPDSHLSASGTKKNDR